MVSSLDTGSSGPGLSPGRGHHVVFLGKTLSQCLFPPTQGEMGTDKLSGQPNKKTLGVIVMD